MISDEGKENIKVVEGILIEAYRRKYDHFTPWNNMSGSVVGQKRVMPNNINIVKSFCSPDDYYINPIVSRSTIRELSQNPEWAWYENYLHGVRMYILMLGMEYQEALDVVRKNDILNTYDKIIKSGYSKKKLII